MRRLTLYSIGSCNPSTRLGDAQALLETGDGLNFFHLELEDTTSKRCIIEGLIEGVRSLEGPAHIVLVTSSKVGYEKALRDEGPNVDLVGTLVDELQTRNCTFRFEVWEGAGSDLREKVLAARPDQ